MPKGNHVFNLAAFISEESKTPVMRAVLGLVHGDLEEFGDGYASAFTNTCEHISMEGKSPGEAFEYGMELGPDSYQDFCLAALVLAADLLSQMTYGESNLQIQLLKRRLDQPGQEL